MPDYTFAITGQDLSGAAWKTFIDNVKKANQQIADLKKPMQDTAASTASLASTFEAVKGRIDGLVGAAKALAGLWVVGQVRDYADRLQATAVQVSALAERTGFTTEQVQALQRAARLSGEDFDKLASTAQGNREWLDKITESARRANTVLGSDTVKALDEAAKAAERSKREAGDLSDNFDRLAGPTITWGLAQISGGFKSMAESLDLIKVSGGAALPTLIEIMNVLSLGQGTRIGAAIGGAGQGTADWRAEDTIRHLEAKVVEARQAVTRNVATHGETSVPARRARADLKEAEDALMAAQRVDMLRRQRNQTRQQERDTRLFNVPIDVEIAEWSRYGAKPTGTGGGGGGGEKRDRIGENLQLYTDQAKAAEDALKDLREVAQQPLPLDDLEREIKLRKAIADAMAQASKFAKDDPRKAQLEQQIRLRETAESEYQKFYSALKTADATERQYGDGQLQSLQTQNQLNDARATGRLTIEAYDNAMKVLAMSTEDLRLKNLGLQGGFTGLVAGWENARVQSDRANNMFATGGKVYEQVMSTMTLATRSWGQTFDQILLNAGASWAQFLANMALQAGASQLWQAVGGLSGIVALLFGSRSGGGASAVTQAPGFGAGFADWFAGAAAGGVRSAGGGPLRAGQPSVVGEFEPELWVPNTGGNVLNRQQLQALGVGGEAGRGGDTYSITQYFSVGQFVTPTELERTKREMMDGAVGMILKMQNSGDARMRLNGF